MTRELRETRAMRASRSKEEFVGQVVSVAELTTETRPAEREPSRIQGMYADSRGICRGSSGMFARF